MSEFDVMPGSVNSDVVRYRCRQCSAEVVPDNIDDDHAVFTEPLAAAYQIVRQLTVEGRPYITVLGEIGRAHV